MGKAREKNVRVEMRKERGEGSTCKRDGATGYEKRRNGRVKARKRADEDEENGKCAERLIDV